LEAVDTVSFLCRHWYTRPSFHSNEPAGLFIHLLRCRNNFRHWFYTAVMKKFIKIQTTKYADTLFVGSTVTPGIRDMHLNPFSLTFPPELEHEYFENYFNKSLTRIRFSLFLAIVLFAVFGFLDAALAGEKKIILWWIRYTCICPGVLTIFLFSFTRHFRRHMQLSIALSMIWVGFCVVSMILVAPPPASYSYYAGLILIFMYGYTFVGLRFVWASLAGWVIVVLYELASLLIEAPVSVLINNNFFFICANTIGMFSCYSIEMSFRRDFYFSKLLELEREKVQSANTELEARVQARTEQLTKANRDLEVEMQERKRAEKGLIQAQKMEAIGTLAGGIAHDFNNILTAVVGYAELGLHKKLIDQGKTEYIFTQILNAGNRAKDLIRHILTFSRQRDEERMPVKLGSIIKEALKLIFVGLPRNVQIQENIRTSDDMVFADPTQVHQIIMNLCTNAAQAMKEQGGILEVALDGLHSDPASKDQFPDLAPGEYLKLTVRDSGGGIDPKVIDRIFDPFFTTKAPGEGTGMGLSVVHGIVKNYGGKIFVSGETGKGTTFFVLLPRLETKASDESNKKDTALPSGSERILFVDDEDTAVEVVKEMLEEMGYSVVTMTNVLEALDLFKENPDRFDMVITDKNMPYMTGFDFGREILQIKPDVPVILCTGYLDFCDTDTAKEHGFRDIIKKPLLMRDMAEAIRCVFDRSTIQ
jgi:signal transduction histidine kinase/ActR/RegA family two-component response regulator